MPAVHLDTKQCHWHIKVCQCKFS